MKKLRVYHVVNGTYSEQICVDTVEKGKELIKVLMERDLHNPSIEFNCFGLEEYSEKAIDGEHWTEWYNEDGEDVMEVIGKENE